MFQLLISVYASSESQSIDIRSVKMKRYDGKKSDKEIAILKWWNEKICNLVIILVEIVVIRTESEPNWRWRAAVLIEWFYSIHKHDPKCEE